MSEINNKMRLLKVLEILRFYTDEQNALSIYDIIEKLQKEYGLDYKVNIKVIKDDLQALENYGYDIEKTTVARNKKLYSLLDRDFEIHELRMLVDALTSARFITKEETRRLIEKVKKLTSMGMAKKLESTIHADGRVKCQNTTVRYNLGMIHDALLENKKISFKYGSYSIEKEFLLRRDGMDYIVDPYRLVWNNGFYYLIAKDIKRGITNFRADRMKDVSICTDDCIKEEIDISSYLNQNMNMFSGEKAEVIKIQFDKKYINPIIDQFGIDTNIRVVDESTFLLTTEAAINDGLINWILSWGGGATVLWPRNLQEKVKNEIEKMFIQYEDT